MYKKDSNSFEMGISTACFYPELTEKALEWIISSNTKYTEIFFNTFSEIEKEYIKDMKKLLSETGTKAVSVHPFSSFAESFMLFTSYERRVNDTLDLYKKYFEVMNILEADIFVLHGLRRDKAEFTGYSDEKYFEIFDRLRNIGREFGIRVAQENIVYCKSGNPEFILKMKKYLNKEVDFVFDIKQAVRYKCDPFDMLNAMGENLIHIHISDNDSENSCLLPGKGSFDFKRLFSELQTISYKGACIIELYRQNFEKPEELLNSLKFLSSIHQSCKSGN